MELVEVMDSEINNVRPYACDWEGCQKGFNRKSDLQRHRRIHTNERPYSCTYDGCRKAFIQRSALTVHNRTHTGEKPHQCQFANCGKKFSDSSSLARHRRIHTGKRPYRCPFENCQKSFCRKTTMVKHQHKHQGKHGPIVHEDGESASDCDSGDCSSRHVIWATGEARVLPQHTIQGLQRAHSYDPYQSHIDPSYAQFGHRYSLSGPANSNSITPMPDHAQFDGSLPLRPIQTSYYVAEQNNPGVATMNTAVAIPRYHPVAIAMPHDRSTVPYQGQPHSASAQTSPGGYSTTSSRSPVSDIYYGHPTPHDRYAIQSPIDRQHSGHYNHHALVKGFETPPPLVLSHITPHIQQYQSPQEQQWYSHAQFQEPVPVISEANSYASTGVYDPWQATKMETYDDPILQLPSARIESL